MQKLNDIKERGNVIFRQELKSLTPNCDSKCAITFNIILMILFLIFGIPIIITTNNVVEFSVDYSRCVSDINGYCTFKLTTNQTISGPVYFYYEIKNFYMNHRDFVRSRSFPQLRGDLHVDSSNNSRCEGARYISEIFNNDTSRYFSWNRKPLKGTDFANPCGLIAKSYFNDTDFLVTNSIGENFAIDDSNIANDYDKKYMFKRHEDSENIQWIDVENLWMQMESFQNFRKLWGKFSKNLLPDTYTIRVKNNYNVTSFNGQKYIVFANSSSIGTGFFFGVILIMGAFVSFILVMILIYLKKQNQNNVYTLHDLKWT